MGKYEGPQFGVVDSRPHRFRFAFVFVALMAMASVVGVTMLTEYRKAVRNAEAADAAERNWILQSHDQIGKLKVALNEADAKIAAIAAENSKPVRKGGKAVPQEKWSEEGAAEYRVAQDNRAVIANSLDKLADDYNKRRSAYTGKWPKGAEPSGNAGWQ